MPERLLPRHLGGEVPEVKAAAKESRKTKTQPEANRVLREAREQALENVPELERDLRLKAIEQFQLLIKQAQDLRSIVKSAKSADDRFLAAQHYKAKKTEIEGWLGDEEKLSFEKAYREYIRSKLDYLEFKNSLKTATQLSGLLEQASFASAEGLDDISYARAEAVSQRQSVSDEVQTDDVNNIEQALKTIFDEESEEYVNALKEFKTQKERKLPRSKKQLQEELAAARAKIEELWEDPMVRYFSGKEEIETVLKQFSEGEDVVETQSVIHSLNMLHEWETQHQRTTVGGVLVGPPGVGKTTLVRHYLEEKGRNYVYLDLSEDVTRYMLYGSKSLEFKDPTEYYNKLSDDLRGLDPEKFRDFVSEHSKLLGETLHLNPDEAAVTAIAQIQESLQAAEKTKAADVPQLRDLQTKVVNMAEAAFRGELAKKFAHIVKKNGWRDGVITAALRRGDSVLMDEFNKNKNWSLIYGLLTAKPGEDWYFADNDERIPIPDNWRMYFTANIERKHGVFEVPEALASRAEGKVMEIPYPPRKEEMLVSLSALANPDGTFLRSKEDLGKLYTLINEAFPKIRSFLEGKRQTIPLSYRTIRDLGEKLVLYRDAKNKKPLYQASKMSFDEAVYQVMVESYKQFEGSENPKAVVDMLTSVGILMDDEKLKDKIMGYIGQEAYDERKKASEDTKKDFEEIIKQIRGLQGFATTEFVPAAKQF